MTDSKRPSNNPAGRPRGVGEIARMRQEMMADGKTDRVIAKLYELAIAGDVSAIRVWKDRVMPVLKPQAAGEPFTLPAGSLTEKAKALLQLAADGALPIDQAADMITAISRVVQVEQGDELRRRLDALEFGDIA